MEKQRKFYTNVKFYTIVCSFFYTCIKFSLFFHIEVLYTQFKFVDLVKIKIKMKSADPNQIR